MIRNVMIYIRSQIYVSHIEILSLYKLKYSPIAMLFIDIVNP